MIGADFPLAFVNDRVSLGAMVSQLFVTGGKADQLGANGALKYWF